MFDSIFENPNEADPQTNNDMAPDARMDPLSNAMFTRMFGRNDAAPATRALINAFFRRAGLDDIGEIKSIHAEHTDIGDVIGCKETRYDIYICTQDVLVDLEAEKKGGDYANRSFMYAAKMLTSEVKTGTEYGSLPQVVVLTLTSAADDELPKPEGRVTVADIRWNVDGEFAVATDRLKFILVDIGETLKRYNEGKLSAPADEADAWMLAFAAAFEEDDMMVSLAEEFPSLEEFTQRYNLAIGDPEVRELYEAEARSWRETRSWQRYFENQEKKAIERGLEKGIEQGIEQTLAAASELGIDDATLEAIRTSLAKERASA